MKKGFRKKKKRKFGTSKKVSISTWMRMKPYDTPPDDVDYYYVNLATEIKKVLDSKYYKEIIREELDKPMIEIFACFISAYLEDVVTDTGVWSAFLNLHEKLYGCPVPFYYDEEEGFYMWGQLNVEDLCFLIWYFISTNNKKKIINPNADFIWDLAEDLLEVLDDAWVKAAPENERLRTFYQFDDEFPDEFYGVREFMARILFNSWLFYPDAAIHLDSEINELLDKSIEDEIYGSMLPRLVDDLRSGLIHSYCTALLALTGREWVMELLGEEHLLYKDLEGMSHRISSIFAYKDRDEKFVFFEHVASGTQVAVRKVSFGDHFAGPVKVGELVHMSIVRWRNEWWLSGVAMHLNGIEDEVTEREKSSPEALGAFQFLDPELEKHSKEILEEQRKAFLIFNDGSPIAFRSMDKLDEFARDFLEFFNKHQGASEEELRKIREKLRQDGMIFEENTEIPGKQFLHRESGLVFFNPNRGIEFYMKVNSAFPLPNNPFFDEELSPEHVTVLLLIPEYSVELVRFCIDHCKDKLPALQDIFKVFRQEDLDFLLRFWKQENYYAKPAVVAANK